jgi:hypothetical protein
MLHAARQLPSWLTYNVRQNKMSEGSSQGAQQSPRSSRARGSVIFAVILAVLGIAPTGLTAPWGGFVAFYDLHGIGALFVFFWILYLLLAVYAASTKSDEHASIAILVIWAIAVLNLSGCAFELGAIDKALG